MMELSREIREWVEKNLKNPGHFVVDVLVTTRKGPRKIMVFLDGDTGIGIDDCAEVSRQLGKFLEERLTDESSYTLDVSSPGVDHPLRMFRQFPKHLGRQLRVHTGGTFIEGKLISATPEILTLEISEGTGKKKVTSMKEVAFSEIEKAFVKISFK